MRNAKAIQIMSALAQPTRLEVYTRLNALLPAGLAAGELASITGTAPTAMSPHLAILARADLVKSTKIGRTIIYRANTKPLNDLIAFLTDANTD